MGWLGALSGDFNAPSNLSSLTYPGSPHPTISEQVISTLISRRAYNYVGASGGRAYNIFTAHHTGGTSTKRFIYLTVALYYVPGTVGASNGIIYTNWQGSYVPSTGAVRLSSVDNGDTPGNQYGFRIEYYNGSAWTNPFTDEAYTSRTKDTVYCCRLTITDNAGAGKGSIALDVWKLDGTGGNVYSGTDIMSVRPCFEQVTVENNNIIGGKGGSDYHKFYLWELMEHDDLGDAPTTAQQYDGETSGAHHAIIRMLSLEDAGSPWLPYLSCDGTRWRAMIDSYKDYADVGDYCEITGASGADKDVLFGVDDVPSSGVTIEAVVYSTHATFNQMYSANGDLIGKDESGTLRVIASPIDHATGGMMATKTRCLDGTHTWTPAIFNDTDFRVGYRRKSASGSTFRVHQSHVLLIGTNLQNPSKIGPCLPAKRSFAAMMG